MSVDDIGDSRAELRELKRRVDRLESGTMLENSSITRGRMRFIGGLLRVDSGGRVEIVGTLNVEGTSQFIGPVTISGKLDVTGDTTVTGEFTLDGPWTINGDGDITGDVDVTGDFTVLGGGRIKVGNVVLTPGNGGRITIGTGSSQIIIDPSQLKVGPAFKMDPAHSSTGAQQAFGLTGKSTVYGDDEGIQIVNLAGDTPRNFSVDQQGFRLMGAPPRPEGMGGWFAFIGTDERLYRATGGIGGGPGDGIFAYPFPLDQVTSEFRPPDRPTHDGMDFGIGPSNTEGTPIPSAGSGVVETIGTPSGNHGWGYFVLVNHGTDPLYGGALIQTRYAHMHQAPPVSVGDPVTLGMTLGGIGNTGNSFGNHLHWEVLVDGVPVNPRTFMAAHGG